ncbi:MAG TPA: hypothetical protein VFX44_05080 [Solirubrobacterales bacterium]|nr:hypothetical protein [Solirubrobacterales bacterium]
MQTMADRDDMLKERFDRVNERFDEVNRRIREGREEVNRRFDEVDRRLSGIEEIKQEMKALQTTFQRGNFALVISIFGVLVATILKGG